jgi:hypothetical protein
MLSYNDENYIYLLHQFLLSTIQQFLYYELKKFTCGMLIQKATVGVFILGKIIASGKKQAKCDLA